uniref:Uncharacterized protein n=1 Tax=Aegilops tauschii subsp. strangulata TaxID=200361 RepID=A0A453QBW8_AEGTS
MRGEDSTLLSEVRHVAVSLVVRGATCFCITTCLCLYIVLGDLFGLLDVGTFIYLLMRLCGMYSQGMVAHVVLERGEGKVFITHQGRPFLCVILCFEMILFVSLLSS